MDSGLRAVMFIDIVGSTEMTARLGDSAALELVRAHDALVRRGLEAYGGREIKHTGDGIMASFDKAQNSVRAAADIQRRFAAYNADTSETLSVRIGIDAGEPVEDHIRRSWPLVKLSRIDKVLSSFGQTLAVLASPITGRIHAHYRIANTASGRATCSGPNLQQVPRDPRFRALFVPEPGNVFIIADYASMELRAAAYMSEDHAMTKAFEQGLDLHRLTASQMTGKDLADVTDEERKGAKCVNFGSVYGQGAGGLVQSAWDQFDVVLDFDEAKAWLQTFADTYYGFTRWRSVHFRACERRRHIVIGKQARDGIGRIYPQSRVPEGGSFYTRCCNLPVQGACADASMLALAYVDDRLFDAGIEGGPVAWLHDEIVLEVRDDQANLAAEILKQAMIDGFIDTFPGAPIDQLVEPHIGMSWAEKS